MTTPEFDVIRDPLWDNIRLDRPAQLALDTAIATAMHEGAVQAFLDARPLLLPALLANGAGAADRSSYDFASLFAGRIQNVGRRYFGGYLAYEITPLVKSANYAVVNLADGSRFFSPTVSLSLRANLDFTLGVQIFSGSTGSEYGTLSDVYYAQAQWFF